MLLLELLGSSVVWKWTTKPTLYVARASFNVGSHRYVVTFEQDYMRTGVPTGHETYTSQYLCYFRLKTVSKKRSEDITGTGNALIVFSTVIDIIKAFRQIMPYSAIVFFSREPSRTSLYKTILSRRFTNIAFEQKGDAMFTIPPIRQSA